MKIFIFFSQIFLFTIISNFAVAKKYNFEKSESPTRIRSDIIDIKKKSQTITFIDNVVVEKDDSSLLSDRMVVIYDKKKKSKNSNESSIKRIDAMGDVKIFSEEFIASGEKGHYDPKKEIFVLERNVIVNNGTSIASGNKFVHDLKTKKGIFVGKKEETSIAGKGGDKRVVVVIGDDIGEINKDSKDEQDSDEKSEEENLKK